MDVFHTLVAAHIVTGSVGLLAFWGPVLSRKGGTAHVRLGRVFTLSMLTTGTIAAGIATTTLLSPLETHPKFEDAALVRGIFGWMMLYLAVLTVSLAVHGWLTAIHKLDRAKIRDPRNVALQILVIVAAVNCFVHGLLIDQVLMMGIAVVGVASGLTNLFYLYRPKPGRIEWLLEHIKALVGAGISVYTAFLAFGAVRLAPSLALNPGYWAIPLTIGVALIIYHQQKVIRRAQPGRKSGASPSRGLAS